MTLSLQKLESLYSKYNKFEYIHPDPLEFVYKYSGDSERELVGLLASSLAYGNVKQILKSVDNLLRRMGDSPYRYIFAGNKEVFMKNFHCFKHRFTTCEDIAKLLLGIQHILITHSSLKKFFVFCLNESKNNFVNAVTLFSKEINKFFDKEQSYLIPSPLNKSACKRLMLYFRWMIRKDEVDPGCWNESVSPSLLIIPLDTHMYNISKQYGFTARKSADFKTAQEISDKFRRINRHDPIKYDFVLTRFGIRDELNYNDLKNHCN